jgi:hypothetical protein
MATVLNPALYRKLQARFGGVRVSSQGESFIARATRGLMEEPRLTISHAGEYYLVCCPFCNDTRYRLYINHMFGQKDGHGRRMTFLAICYNEGCLSRQTNKQTFLERMNDNGWLENTTVLKGIVVPEEAREVFWPGPCRLLSTLRDSHRANEYLASRGFDPDELSEKFGVRYCKSSDHFLASNRIIVPVFDRGKLKGWQARYVGELPWKDKEMKKDLPPKYFSCPNSQFRSKCIYNFDSMRQWQTGVVVEGSTDVWRGGSMFGGIFGNTITDVQFQRLLSAFKERTLVMCLDPEEYESRSTQRRIREFTARMSPKTFCAVKLPDHTDPGSLDRTVLKEYIREAAADRGVKVTYRRVA